MLNSNFICSMFVGILLIMCSSNCYAYLDPGSGGILLQLIFGGVSGLCVVLKLYWDKIRSFFGFTVIDKQEVELIADDEEQNGE